MKILNKIKDKETQRNELQSSIDAERSLVERNRLGQFATPNALAIEIVRCIARDWPEYTKHIRFADPSIGSGSFFSAALSVFGVKGLEHSVGIELDSRFVSTARELWRGFGLEVIQGDFTQIIGTGQIPCQPNLVLANPPYIRHHHINRIDKERLQQLTARLCGVNVNGLAGLYVYFLLLATAWMKENGIAAWLIPSEFMDVNYGMALKGYLTDRITLDRIHRFNPDDVQFGDALVSSVVLFFRKQAPAVDHVVNFTYGGTLEQPDATESVQLVSLREARKWTVYPAHKQNDRHRSANNDDPTLSDFFRVQRGIVTGNNKFFVLEQAEVERRDLPKRFLRPILPSPRHLKTTVVDSDKDGFPVLDQQFFVIDCDLPEDLIKSQYPTLWDYLKTAEELGIRNGYIVGKRTPWYKQEQREAAPFLCTYMGRGSNEKRPFRFIWNRSIAIGTNLYLMLYPLNDFASMLRNYPERYLDVYNFFNDITGYELRGEGRVYGGGLNKIEPSELGRISAVSLIQRWPELAIKTDRNAYASKKFKQMILV